MKRISALLLLGLPALTTQAVTVSIQVLKAPTCTYADGRLRANASGGVGPYTYVWSTGATTQTIEGLLAGSYSVTVTDFNSDQASANFTLVAGDYGQVNWLTGDHFNYGNGLCSNMTHLGFDPATLELPGPAPYYIGGVQLDTMWYEDPFNPWEWLHLLATPVFNPVSGYNSFTFADGNGCPGTWDVSIGWPVQWPVLSVVSIQGACDGTTSGSITISSTGEGHQQGVQTLIEPEVPNYPYHPTGGGPSTFTISALAAGTYTLTQFMSMTPVLPSSGCSDTFSFTIPSLGPGCGVVSGAAFVDNNQNCVRNNGEAYLPGTVLEILPGPYYLLTDASGHYEQVLPLGDYTVEQQSPNFQEHCTGTPIPFTLSSVTPMVTTNLPDTSLVPMDAMVATGSGSARPGFQFDYALNVRNLTPTSTGAVTTTFVVDPTLNYLSATPAPNNVTGNTLTWNQISLGAWQERNIIVRTMVPPDINLLGTVLASTATLATANSDGDLANNTATNLRTITGAYDPNDKLAVTSSGSSSSWIIDADEWIDYTIRFQNTGTDTAFNVIITDTLPPSLDPASIIRGAASHTHTWQLFGQGVLKFIFTNILLPDSNVNEPRSHGFVSFRTRPHLPISPGATIENIANIYFDFNPPVITEPSVLVAEFSTGVGRIPFTTMLIAPNPATDILRVTLQTALRTNAQVLSVDGRTIAVPITQQAHALELDVRFLAPGPYLIRTEQGTARFVKQ